MHTAISRATWTAPHSTTSTEMPSSESTHHSSPTKQSPTRIPTPSTIQTGSEILWKITIALVYTCETAKRDAHCSAPAPQPPPSLWNPPCYDVWLFKSNNNGSASVDIYAFDASSYLGIYMCLTKPNATVICNLAMSTTHGQVTAVQKSLLDVNTDHSEQLCASFCSQGLDTNWGLIPATAVPTVDVPLAQVQLLEGIVHQMSWKKTIGSNSWMTITASAY